MVRERERKESIKINEIKIKQTRNIEINLRINTSPQVGSVTTGSALNKSTFQNEAIKFVPTET